MACAPFFIVYQHVATLSAQLRLCSVHPYIVTACEHHAVMPLSSLKPGRPKKRCVWPASLGVIGSLVNSGCRIRTKQLKWRCSLHVHSTLLNITLLTVW